MSYIVEVPFEQDQTFLVTWEHTKQGTACYIFRGSGKFKREDGERVAWGASERNPLDQQNKDVGRRVSLTRAIDSLFPYPQGEYNESEKEYIRLNFRKPFWDGYFAMQHKTFGKCDCSPIVTIEAELVQS